MAMKGELARRVTCRDKVEALLRAHAGEWVSMADLAEVGGIGGWRTRLSELNTLRGLNICWNGKNGSASAHRLVPRETLGRDADSFVAGNPTTGTLFDLHPGPFSR